MTNGCERRQLSGLASRLGLGGMVCGCVAGLILVAGCNQAPAPVDTKAAEDAVRAADAAALKAAQALDAATSTSYLTDDTAVMPPNVPVVSGEGGGTDDMGGDAGAGNPDVAGLRLKVQSAASGDMVYDQGTYSLTAKGPDGKPMSDTGKYLAVCGRNSLTGAGSRSRIRGTRTCRRLRLRR